MKWLLNERIYTRVSDLMEHIVFSDEYIEEDFKWRLDKFYGEFGIHGKSYPASFILKRCDLGYYRSKMESHAPWIRRITGDELLNMELGETKHVCDRYAVTAVPDDYVVEH